MSDDLKEIVRKSAEAQRKRDQQDQVDAYFDVYGRLFDRAAAYTKGVIIAGYASIFAVWGFTRDLMPPTLSAISGLLLLVSSGTFVLWEVFSNIRNARLFRGIAKRLLGDPFTVAAMQQYETESRQGALESAGGWWTVIVVSLVTAVGALGVMFWSLASSLWTAL